MRILTEQMQCSFAERRVWSGILTLATLIAVSSLLNSCVTTPPAVTADGSGYSHTPLKPESEAYLINNDRPALKSIKGNNGTCAKHAGCTK